MSQRAGQAIEADHHYGTHFTATHGLEHAVEGGSGGSAPADAPVNELDGLCTSALGVLPQGAQLRVRVLDAGRSDLLKILARLEEALRGGRFLCGDLSIADLAIFPHVSSLKPLGITLDPATHPSVVEWNRRMRSLAIVWDVDAWCGQRQAAAIRAPAPIAASSA